MGGAAGVCSVDAGQKRATDVILTAIERAILSAVAEGKTHETIARDRGRSIKTVRKQLTTLYLKIEARNGAHAVYLAVKAGWL